MSKEDPKKRVICVCCSHDQDYPVCIHEECPHFEGGQSWKIENKLKGIEDADN